jgi:protein-L-isoaspartate(D-aspartate) O-methyltransferase
MDRHLGQIGKGRIRALTVLVFLALSLRAETCVFPQSPGAERADLIRTLAGLGINDAGVLAAIGRVPREVFIEEPLRKDAYEDVPLPIGEGQTISQPFVVALMTQALGLVGRERVLEVGTGSGYQTAVLAQMVKTVYTVEIREALARKAWARLTGLGYRNVHARVGDGYEGWPLYAPFDAIMVTASAREIPKPLFDQLAEGGRLIMPVGEDPRQQDLTLVTKIGGKLRVSVLAEVAFVRMTGKAETATH